jgi:hypothetical protein
MIATPQQSDSPDEIEHQLVAFFRREVPAPWPTLTVPVKMPATVRPPRAGSSSRAALAVSVAILLFGGWFLSGRLPTPVPSAGSLDSGSATVPSGLRTGGQSMHRH